MQESKEQIPGFILERTAKRMKQFFSRTLKSVNADITADQWVVLQELSKSDKQSQLKLAQATFKDAPTITRIIDILCKKGLTERLPDPTDRRRFQITLTPKGKDKIAALMPKVKAFRKEVWAALSDEEINQLMKMLNAIFDTIK